MIKPVFVYFTHNKIVVVVALSYDLSFSDTEWMADPDLPPGECFEPTLDLFEEKFFFDRNREGEKQAFLKVAELYAAQLQAA